jgi:hypothetical protein
VEGPGRPCQGSFWQVSRCAHACCTDCRDASQWPCWQDWRYCLTNFSKQFFETLLHGQPESALGASSGWHLMWGLLCKHMPNDAAFVVYVAWQVMRVVKWRVLGSHVKGDFQSPAGLLVCACMHACGTNLRQECWPRWQDW